MLITPDGVLVIVVSGGSVGVVAVQFATTGVGSALPAWSTARAVSLCRPLEKPVRLRNDEHGVKVPALSILHSNVPGSVLPSVNVAVETGVVESCPARSVVSGGSTSTVQLVVTGDGSTLPARSTARTASECAPSASPVTVKFWRHGKNPEPSRLHSKRPTVSSESKLKLAVVGEKPFGPVAIEVPGEVVSTETTAGLASPVAPLVATARTTTV